MPDTASGAPRPWGDFYGFLHGIVCFFEGIFMDLPLKMEISREFAEMIIGFPGI